MKTWSGQPWELRGPIRRAFVRTLVALVVLALAGAPAVAYHVRTFEVAGEPITGGRGLDDGDCVAGYYQSDPSDFSTAHAIVRCAGTTSTIDPPTSTGDRRAFDVNNSGVVVGSALRASGNDGFELDGGVYTWVEYPGADQTVIRGINDAGDIAGEYETAGGSRRGFARIGGGFVAVDVPLAAETRARGINNAGEVVGTWTDGAGLRHGFIREPSGIFTTLDFPGAVETLFGDTDDDGAIVGTSFDGAGVPHGFVITAPLVQFLPFDVPGSAGTFATGINEAGELTGEWVDGAGVRRGFVATPILFADGFESGDAAAWSAVQP